MLTRVQKGSNFYAAYEIDNSLPIDKVSMMMINHNQSEFCGLAPITLEEMNGNYTSMLFDITGRITLREYSTKNISQEDFRSVLLNLINTIEGFDEYMIDTQQILLGMDSVFINELDHTVVFLCIALKGVNFDGNLYEFFKNIVDSSYVRTDDNGVSYFNRVWNLTRSGNGFAINNIKMAISPTGKSAVVTPQDNKIPMPSMDMSEPGPKRVEEPSTLTITPNLRKQEEYVPPVPMPAPQEEKKKGLRGLFSGSKKKKNEAPPPSNNFQGGLSSLVNNKPGSGNLNPKQQIPVPPMPQQQMVAPQQQTAAPQAVPGNMPAANNFGGTTVLTSAMRQQQQLPPPPVGGAPAPSPDVPPVTKPIPAPAQNQNPVSAPPMSSAGTTVLKKPEPADAGSVGTTVLNPAAAASPGTTVLKAAAPKQTVSLTRVKNHQRIIINKPVIHLGRDTEGLDFNVNDNTAVGHRHADVVQRGEEFFIVDLRSTNHTYVNGVVVQPNVETLLHDGDRILLADEEFEFRIV